MFKATACLCISLFVSNALAGVDKGPQSAKQLDRAWQAYINTADHHSVSTGFPHQACFKRTAAAHDLPMTLLLAVARGESNFNADAVSSANAIGLMQILWPGTAKHLGIIQRKNLFKPCINIDAGGRYLKELLSRYKGNLHRALAAYNYGPGRIAVQGSAMPKGALWYSGYIYRHLNFVLSKKINNEKIIAGAKAASPHNTERQLNLITFRTPYRAKAFINNLKQHQAHSPFADRLEWIRVGRRAFRVVLLYSSASELTRAKRWLTNAGFSG